MAPKISMRSRQFIVAATLTPLLGAQMIGCGKTAASPKKTPPPVVVPRANVAASSKPSPSGPAKGLEGAEVVRAGDSAGQKAAIERLIGARACLYSMAQKRLIYGTQFTQEGTGLGLYVYSKLDTKDAEKLDGYEPYDDETSARTKLVGRLTKTLGTQDWVVLAVTNWPDQGNQLSITKPSAKFLLTDGKVELHTQHGIARINSSGGETYTVRPSHIAHSPAAPFAVVTLNFDPGEKYTEGLNNYNKSYVMWYPAAQ